MTTPAGWYDDGSGTQRYWDGSTWIDQTEIKPPPPYVPTATETTEVAHAGRPSRKRWIAVAIALIAVLGLGGWLVFGAGANDTLSEKAQCRADYLAWLPDVSDLLASFSKGGDPTDLQSNAETSSRKLLIADCSKAASGETKALKSLTPEISLQTLALYLGVDPGSVANIQGLVHDAYAELAKSPPPKSSGVWSKSVAGNEYIGMVDGANAASVTFYADIPAHDPSQLSSDVIAWTSALRREARSLAAGQWPSFVNADVKDEIAADDAIVRALHGFVTVLGSSDATNEQSLKAFSAYQTALTPKGAAATAVRADLGLPPPPG
jgi:hypothetical protein